MTPEETPSVPNSPQSDPQTEEPRSPENPSPSLREIGPEETPSGAGGSSLDALLDVSMPVIIEIGRTHMTLSELLQLREGSVVQLDRMVGDAVDIHVSDRKLAEGEIVMVGDHFGVRVTRVLRDERAEAAA